jgi:FlaA1/EpsC-like NDP-sugar epimerase
MKMTDLASVVAPDAEQLEVGIRPGEKLHEQMIGEGDSASTYDYEEYYKILPMINGWDEDSHRIKNGTKVPEDFIYDSSTNDHWMTNEELTKWLQDNSEKLGKI